MATLQEMTNEAIRIAREYWDAIPEGGAQPRFNGTTFVVPANDAGRQLADLCMVGVPANVTGVARATILATAVQTAEIHYTTGKQA